MEGNVLATQAHFFVNDGLVISSGGLSLNSQGLAHAGKVLAASLSSRGDIVVGDSLHTEGEAEVAGLAHVGGSLHVSATEDSSSSLNGAAIVAGHLAATKGATFAGGLYLQNGGNLNLREGGIKRVGKIDMDPASGTLSSTELRVAAGHESTCASVSTCGVTVGIEGLRVSESLHVKGQLYAGTSDAVHGIVGHS